MGQPPSIGANPVTSTSYGVSSHVTGVTFGSADSAEFAFDPNTGRETQYSATVNGSVMHGDLTWNANGSLKTLAIADPFNAADAQTCNYTHDDLMRIASANCGSPWSQTFGYDAFGNLTKSGSLTWNPGYNVATNRYTLAGTTYDANGNLTADTFHTYTWDVEARPVTVDAIGLTYDALGRMVEENNAGVFNQYVYALGKKLAVMNGQTMVTSFVPLPGGAAVKYTGSTLNFYRYVDWLGSIRASSTPSRTVPNGQAFAPFGERYAVKSTPPGDFTGQMNDTATDLYDFLYREQHNGQGRWISPDPAGLAAVDAANPQSWNRYAYVVNRPLTLTDPRGLCALFNSTSVDENGNFVIHHDVGPCPWEQPWLIFPNFQCTFYGLCSNNPTVNPANNGTWDWIKSTARKIGNYIPTPCGGGVFAYGGRMAGPTAATLQVAKWGQYDTRDGTSSGIFTELSGGELLTVGVGQQGPLGGAQEHYLFVGAGGDAKLAGVGVQGNISAFGSDSASFGYAFEGGLGKWSGGVGIYQNFDTLTSCLDHGGH